MQTAYLTPAELPDLRTQSETQLRSLWERADPATARPIVWREILSRNGDYSAMIAVREATATRAPVAEIKGDAEAAILACDERHHWQNW